MWTAGKFYGDANLDKGKILFCFRHNIVVKKKDQKLWLKIVIFELFSCKAVRLNLVKITWNSSLSPGKWFSKQNVISTGIQTSQDAKFYGISAKFEEPFSNEDKTLVIQFQVKHEQNIDCGGGYVKVSPCQV